MTTTRGRTLTLRVTGFPDMSLDSQEFAALQGTSGFQEPPRQVRWWEGSGDGKVYRSTKISSRPVTLPVLIKAANVDALEDALSQLARRFDPDSGLARLILDEGPSRGQWYLDVAYIGGLDLVYGKDTDGSSWATPTLALEAGIPYWTRLDSLTVPIVAAGAGRGLLKGNVSLSALRQASGQTLGTVTFDNPGDAKAYPVVTMYGPALSGTFSSGGLTYTWAGVLLAGQRRIFDHKTGTLIDPDASNVYPATNNRYNELGPAPKFWAVRPGTSQATVQLTGDTPGTSRVDIAYQPRKWLVV